MLKCSNHDKMIYKILYYSKRVMSLGEIPRHGIGRSKNINLSMVFETHC